MKTDAQKLGEVFTELGIEFRLYHNHNRVGDVVIELVTDNHISKFDQIVQFEFRSDGSFLMVSQE